MPKPKTKKELLFASQQNFKKLTDLVDSFSETDIKKEFPQGTMNRNVRDILAHLHHWHLLFLNWYEIGMSGKKPDMPAKGFSWKETPELNRAIWEDYQTIDFKKVKKALDNSFARVQKIIQQHSDTELFTKEKYKWTGSTSLGAYLISNTFSHYDWAIKQIKKSTKIKS